MARWRSRGRRPSHTFHTCWKQHRYEPLSIYITAPFAQSVLQIGQASKAIMHAQQAESHVTAPPPPAQVWGVVQSCGASKAVLHVCRHTRQQPVSLPHVWGVGQ